MGWVLWAMGCRRADLSMPTMTATAICPSIRLWAGGRSSRACSGGVWRDEWPLLALDLGQLVLSQQAGEEALRQVFGCFVVLPLPPHISVKGVPVGAAELLQSFGSQRRGRVASVEHEAPMGGGKPVAVGGSGDFCFLG